MNTNDTICAIATGMGSSAIATVRVSGPEAICICSKIFKLKNTKRGSLTDIPSFSAAYGFIMDGERIVDEAIALVMKAPHTFTTEDTVELSIHGGAYLAKRVMDVITRNGSRVAEPGEFTKRAFLGGRIDMTEAEAVMDMVNARSDMAHKASVGQLTGKLRDEIVGLREIIIHDTAYIEAALDDPENYSLDGFGDELRARTQDIRKRIAKLISTADEGRVVREGINTAIAGRPNVGKSSLLNMLLGEERAIVTDIEGTTRDTLTESIDIGGIVLNLIDTAGIRETEDAVERIGVDRARESIEKADLVLLVIDSSENLNDEDKDLLELTKDKKRIILLNKSDKSNEAALNEAIDSYLTENEISDGTVLSISALTGAGEDILKDKIRDMFISGNIDYNSEIIITRMRHKELLSEADAALSRVQDSLDAGVGEDFLTIDLMDAYESLGKIIGEELEDDLADKIFSEFCMGK